MSIYKTAINKPVTTLLIFVALMVIGLFSFSKLPIDQFPEMEIPAMSVITTYSGANTSDVETNVTRVLEDQLNSVDHLKEITSTSSDGMSMISLEFEWGTDIDATIYNEIVTNMKLQSPHRPIIIVADTFNRIVFVSQGYSKGLG